VNATLVRDALLTALASVRIGGAATIRARGLPRDGLDVLRHGPSSPSLPRFAGRSRQPPSDERQRTLKRGGLLTRGLPPGPCVVQTS
jgi:hypothetical protein